MKIKTVFILVIILILTFCTVQNENNTGFVDLQKLNDKTIIVQKLNNDENLHQAFTDLVFFESEFFLAFRESDLHVTGRDGIIKIYNSPDGFNFKLIKIITIDGSDLRDPKFSINGNQLMLYIHGSHFKMSNFEGSSDYVLKYLGDNVWSDAFSVFLDNKKVRAVKLMGNEAWPWRMTWFNNKAYSVGYNGVDIFDLYESEDGILFKGKNAFEKISGFPNEATIRFKDSGEMYILYRNSKANSFIGRSSSFGATIDWFKEIPIYNFGGPNFLFLDASKILITGRESDQVILSLYNLKNNEYKKLLILESGGDCGYAGMVFKDGYLHLSYYSSHATPGGASVYVARIEISSLLIE